MAVGFGANTYAQKKSNFIASYSIALPTGDLGVCISPKPHCHKKYK